MHAFVYTALPSKVLFGFGTLDKVADEVRMLGCRRALVLSTPQQVAQAEDLAAKLGDLSVGTFTQATMHTPVAITEQALDVVRERQADCTVALGGGSTTGLGKAIALRTDLPQIVVPTTYAGSEATPILGETEAGRKTTQRTLKVLPELIVYDVDLTLTLPTGLTVTSGMNAIAHAVEALYSPDDFTPGDGGDCSACPRASGHRARADRSRRPLRCALRRVGVRSVSRQRRNGAAS